MKIKVQKTVPADADAFYQKAMKQINRKHVDWIKKKALDMNSRNLDENAVSALAKTYGQVSGLSNMDIEALVILVMMKACEDAQEDLKSVMAELKANNDKKEELRQVQHELEKSKPNITKAKLDSFRVIVRSNINNLAVRQTKRLQTTQPLKTTNVVTSQNASLLDMKQVLDELKGKLHGLNEMSEMTSLRLQMIMDRRNKFISTLSNIMKKVGTSANSLIQNMK